MKIQTFLTAALASIVSAVATPTEILWRQDSPTDFDLTVLGIGFGSDNTANRPTYTSPSGLWELQSLNAAWYAPDDPTRFFYGGGEIAMLSWNDLFFRGDSSLYFFTYFNGPATWPALPIYTPRVHGGGNGGYQDDPMWKGVVTLAVLDTPVLEDSSTWQWAFHMAVHRAHVPEAGGTLAFLSFGSMIIAALRRKLS